MVKGGSRVYTKDEILRAMGSRDTYFLTLEHGESAWFPLFHDGSHDFVASGPIRIQYVRIGASIAAVEWPI